MTNKEMIRWYSDYKGYTLSTTRNLDSTKRRIIAYLYIDLAQGILTRNRIRELKALKGITEFCELADFSYPDIS